MDTSADGGDVVRERLRGDNRGLLSHRRGLSGDSSGLGGDRGGDGELSSDHAEGVGLLEERSLGEGIDGGL